jgi:diaminopimelate decarboxylase
MDHPPPQLPADTLLRIAAEYGTPLYVYDAARIRHQYLRLTKAFSGTRMRVFYACKALSNIRILKTLHALGAGLDTVSIGEIRLGMMAGFRPEDIIFTPNGVDLDEIIAAKDLGVNLNIDNLSILEQFGNRFGGSHPVCIRINPHILAGGHHKISTGHIDSKFGISIHQVRHIERLVKTTGIHVRGLHMHTGSEIMDTDVFLRGVEILYELAVHFPQIEFIDMGSGFKVPYQPGDPETDVEELGTRMAESFNKFTAQFDHPVELWFEPGKYLVSEAGYFLVKANVVKQTTATVFVGVNSGFNHLIRPMFYEAYHRIGNLSNPAGTERIYTVVGNVCETDTFAWDRKLNEVREGDILCFYNAGAYGYEMASSFNSRPRPAEVLVDGGQAALIRKADTFEDLVRNQVVG